MPFIKGQSANPNGRPKGSKNKNSQAVRDLYLELLTSSFNEIRKHIKEINANKDPIEAMELLLKLSSFVLPKLTATDITFDGIENPINIILPSNPIDKDKNNPEESLPF